MVARFPSFARIKLAKLRSPVLDLTRNSQLWLHRNRNGVVRDIGRSLAEPAAAMKIADANTG
jgi:hypothetical protein